MQDNSYSLILKPCDRIEIVHHADDELMVYSKFNKVTIKFGKNKVSFHLPLNLFLRLVGQIRLVRRALRLDKSCITLSFDRKSLIITYNGNIYHYCIDQKILSKTHNLKYCRTVLHMSIAVLAPNVVILGEYGRNSSREGVPLYMSQDGGRTWKVPFVFSQGSIRHVHGVYYDQFTKHIWVPTGDFDGECYLYEFKNSSLKEPIIHGNGSQIWRTVSLFFTPSSVVWAMDSELEPSRLIVMDKCSGVISKGTTFPGPVWYIKTLVDGHYLLQTTVENGEGVVTKNAHIYISSDLLNWVHLDSFVHDGWPLRFFKNAVIAFSTGAQSASQFYLSAEAIKGMDGKAFECHLKINQEDNYD